MVLAVVSPVIETGENDRRARLILKHQSLAGEVGRVGRCLLLFDVVPVGNEFVLGHFLDFDGFDDFEPGEVLENVIGPPFGVSLGRGDRGHFDRHF